MSTLAVKLFGTLRLDLGVGEVVIDLPRSLPLREVLEEIARKLGPEKGELFKSKLLREGELCPGVIILRNGVNVCHLQGLDTPIEARDRLVIFPPGGGG